MSRILLLFVLSVGCLAAADWPHFRGPDQTSAVVADPALTAWQGAREMWTAQVGIGSATPVVVGGRVVAVGYENDQDIVRCFDATTGEELWQYSYPARLEARAYYGGHNATPTIINGLVYGIGKQGQAWCLRLSDGGVVWTRDLQKQEGLRPPQWGFAGAPLSLGRVMIYNAGPGGIALRQDTGATVWSGGRGGGGGYAAPVLASDERGAPVLIFAAKHLIAVDPQRGQELWRVGWDSKYDVNAATPVATAGGWFLSTGYGRGCGLAKVDSGGASLAWQNRNMMTQMAGTVLVDRHLYGVSAHSGRPGELRCLDPADEGAVRWKQGGFGQGTVIVVNDLLLVLSGNGHLSMVRADPAAFQELGKARILDGTCWAPPSYADGRLYARNSVGKLVSVALR